MPAGKLFQLTITGSLNGQFVQNILHYQFDDTGTAAPFLAAVALANAWVASVALAWRSILPESYEMSSVRAAQVSDGGGATYTQTSGVAGTTGARSAEISVSTVGPLLCFPATVDDAVVGKIFMPGVAEDDIAYNFLESGLIADINAMLATLLDSIAVSGSVIGTFYYVIANAAKDNWAKPDGGYVSATIGTQRRRAKPSF